MRVGVASNLAEKPPRADWPAPRQRALPLAGPLSGSESAPTLIYPIVKRRPVSEHVQEAQFRIRLKTMGGSPRVTPAGRYDETEPLKIDVCFVETEGLRDGRKIDCYRPYGFHCPSK